MVGFHKLRIELSKRDFGKDLAAESSGAQEVLLRSKSRELSRAVHCGWDYFNSKLLCDTSSWRFTSILAPGPSFHNAEISMYFLFAAVRGWLSGLRGAMLPACTQTGV